MPVKRRQIETDRGSYYNKEDGQKYFQTVKVHFSMVMKVMIVIMTMRIIMKIMNSSSYLRVLPIITTKQFHHFSYKNKLTISPSASTLYTVTCSEAVVQMCSVKQVFLEISQSSQENTCASLFFKSMSEKLYFCETEQILSKQLILF